MATVLPTNEECSRLFLEVGQHGSREFFERLRVHAAAHGLLEPGFDVNLRAQFHELFWELYLASALHRFGFELKRGKENSTEPDYSFPNGQATVFVEAVACGDPSDAGNRVTPPSMDEDSDFEDGFAPDGKIMQRLAQAIDAKITAVTRLRALEAMQRLGDYQVVIALNGCRALNGYPHNDPGVPFVPFVVQTLFGAVEQRLGAGGRTFWAFSSRMEKSPGTGSLFPLAHFDQPTWRIKDRKTGAMKAVSTAHIAGVLYSQVSAEYTALPLGDDFVFVQNPHSPDATGLFRFCKGGVWVREGDVLRRLPQKEVLPPPQTWWSRLRVFFTRLLRLMRGWRRGR